MAPRDGDNGKRAEEEVSDDEDIADLGEYLKQTAGESPQRRGRNDQEAVSPAWNAKTQEMYSSKVDDGEAQQQVYDVLRNSKNKTPTKKRDVVMSPGSNVKF